jgi:glycosyltransferase involved in cell wall biosynthesis
MKVCLITSTYKLSADDPNVPFLVEKVRHLREQGVQVQVFAPAYEGLGDQVLDGVRVHRFRYFFKRWENLTHKQGAPNRLRNPVYLLVAAFYIVAGLFAAVRLCRRERFDVLHVHWPFPHGIWGYCASRLSGAPMVLSFHGAELLLQRKYPFVAPFLRHALRHAAAATCNSRYTAGEAAKLSDRPLVVIPYGATVDARPAAKDRSRSVRELLFVGRLVRRKGLDVLLNALVEIHAQMSVHLHVVGDGDRADEWKALARTLGVADRVTFHGAVSKQELERRYASADVFVLPAIVDERGDTEGLGVVLVEALSFMTPVIASHVGGIPDVIHDGETGLLVPQQDPGALARAVLRLLRDDELASRLAQRGLAHAREYFDWGRIVAQLIDIYRDAVALQPQAHGAGAAPRRADALRLKPHE